MCTEERNEDRVRLLALYLPQFHRVKENDEWWGEGFTEWTAVKEAKPLFPGHKQPQHPLNDNYYDLMDKKTMEWQAGLAKKYSIDGFCFYHYYFKDGRKILEKPAENLLKWQDIDMPFCFNWANESWARTWKKFVPGKTVNVWASTADEHSSTSKLLLKQEYGMELEWESHFEYLLPFFKDERYIKLEGKPVFLIHQPDEITCLTDMLELWDKLARQAGFPGIYVIGDEVKSPYAQLAKSLQGRMMHFPTVSLLQARTVARKDNLFIYDYIDLCQMALSYDIELDDGRPSYYCLGPGFDTTPRSGNHGCVLTNRSVDVFRETLLEMLVRSKKEKKAFIFLNAWNEWGESMHLEPDEEDGYSWLIAVKEAVEQNHIASLQPLVPSPRERLQMKMLSIQGERSYTGSVGRKYIDIWLSWLQNGGGLVPYLHRKGYQRIALYGYGVFGKHVLKEFQHANVMPICIIDQKAKSMASFYPILSLQDDLPEFDVILVTTIWHNQEIMHNIRQITNSPIIFLRELLDDVCMYEID